MLRAISEIYSRDKNSEVAKQNFMAAIYSALTKYGLSDYTVFDFAAWAILNIENRDLELAKELVFQLTKTSNRILARILIEKLPIELAEIPAWFLLANLNHMILDLFPEKRVQKWRI
jgi:hypothetical protein